MKAFEFKPKLFTTLKNYSKDSFMADLMAGIIVGIVALPLAIAFGIASGVSPEKVLSLLLLQALSFLYWEEAKYKSADRQARLSLSSTVSYKNMASAD